MMCSRFSLGTLLLAWAVVAIPDKRIVAYTPNWVACPSATELSQYTHAMVAFAVTYSVNSGGSDNCASDTTCTIQTTPGCGGKTLAQMTTDFHAAGVDVILSFGGAGMGGSWEAKGGAASNKCWEHCLNKVDSVVTQLAQIVANTGIDGIDIDYEYFVDELKYQTFLGELIDKLYTEFSPSGLLLTHAPMDVDLCNTGGLCVPHYRDIIQARASKIDFIMPQYYNGVTRPVNDFAPAEAHFAALKTEVFGGDGSKIVFGLCISDCAGTGSNANTDQALSIVTALQNAHPDNGGMMFWDSRADGGGAWSKKIFQYYSCDLDAFPEHPPPAQAADGCGIFTPAAGTASCDTFLPSVAGALGTTVAELISVERDPNDTQSGSPPLCTKGGDGTYATSPNTGLWGGYPLRVCGPYDPNAPVVDHCGNPVGPTQPPTSTPTGSPTSPTAPTSTTAPTAAPVTACVRMTPAAGTGTCTPFLAAAASALSVSVAALESFTRSDTQAGTPPMCTKGNDGTFATAADTGLWAGYEMEICGPSTTTSAPTVATTTSAPTAGPTTSPTVDPTAPTTTPTATPTTPRSTAAPTSANTTPSPTTPQTFVPTGAPTAPTRGTPTATPTAITTAAPTAITATGTPTTTSTASIAPTTTPTAATTATTTPTTSPTGTDAPSTSGSTPAPSATSNSSPAPSAATDTTAPSMSGVSPSSLSPSSSPSAAPSAAPSKTPSPITAVNGAVARSVTWLLGLPAISLLWV